MAKKPIPQKKGKKADATLIIMVGAGLPRPPKSGRKIKPPKK